MIKKSRTLANTIITFPFIALLLVSVSSLAGTAHTSEPIVLSCVLSSCQTDSGSVNGQNASTCGWVIKYGDNTTGEVDVDNVVTDDCISTGAKVKTNDAGNAWCDFTVNGSDYNAGSETSPLLSLDGKYVCTEGSDGTATCTEQATQQ